MVRPRWLTGQPFIFLEVIAANIPSCGMNSCITFNIHTTWQKNSSTNTSPFEACLGYLPRSPLDFIFEKYVTIASHSDIDKAMNFIEKIQLVHHTVEEQLEKSQSIYKARNEKHQVYHKFQVGDEVWLYISKEILQWEVKKLKPICYGPFRILEILVQMHSS